MVERILLNSNGKMMMVKVKISAGFEGDIDQHVEEQLTYVEKGKVEFLLGGENYYLKEGDTLFMPSNVPHKIKVIENCVLLDIFSPAREDILKLFNNKSKA